jgi:hypothetical protein
MSPTQHQSCVFCQAPKRKYLSLVKRAVGALCILALCSMTFSCKKRGPIDVNVAGQLKLEPARFSNAIPDDYGPLVGVTQNPTDSGWVGLWFQKSDKTVTAVFVNINQGRIYEKTLTIPRK